jgi:hypothetical protein
VKNDYMHVRARKNFSYFAGNNVKLVTSSFVLVETTALLQNRIGLPPVNDFNAKILPLLEKVNTLDTAVDGLKESGDRKGDQARFFTLGGYPPSVAEQPKNEWLTDHLRKPF